MIKVVAQGYRDAIYINPDAAVAVSPLTSENGKPRARLSLRNGADLLVYEDGTELVARLTATE